ncbi:hypothetical protein [Candidatus Methanoperedens nitratireducens]|uniref:Uncharacterized protein n=1 Tax=Candidatus Methanoperedens nitratireducens TaxID=1392998 RepID=A0A284VSK4_9EURY|nr:hypothetical protein [Candidatus Methanoperedens nitroreducens]SNQ62270.1 hypothetical protein MNV_660008 [Candidatus Methanoperedens nitroreducens]
MREVEEQRARQRELIDEINTRITRMEQRLDVVENDRRLGSDAPQRRKFLRDSLEEPEYRVEVTKHGEVYQL